MKYFRALAAIAAIFSVFTGSNAAAKDHGVSDNELSRPSCENRSAQVDANFPAGAFAACEPSGKKSFKLTIAPEDDGKINCSAWYAFRLTPNRRGRVTVELDYTTCGHRYWPKISTDGVNWKYLPKKSVTIEGEGDEKSARLSIKLHKKPVFIAAQEILPPSVYQSWLGAMEDNPLTTHKILGHSAEGREIPWMRIADPAGQPRETVVLLGRQHPPEVTGALAMFPFVEAVLEDTDIARRYRARFETIVVPLLNPDGVMRGYWRHNTGGVDLNRDWGPFTQPETQLMRDLFKTIEQDTGRNLRLMLDFHSTQRDIFYTIPDELPTDPELFTQKWLKRYQERMPDYQVNRDARHSVGRPISKAFVFDTYGVPGVTFELGDETDRELIQRIGHETAIAMMETLLETERK